MSGDPLVTPRALQKIAELLPSTVKRREKEKKNPNYLLFSCWKWVSFVCYPH